MHILTGIQPSGTIHFGNIVGVIHPTIELLEKNKENKLFVCIADYHALTNNLDINEIKRFTHQIAQIIINICEEKAILQKVYIYRQSRINLTFMLYWKLLCLINQGQMERLHTIKEYKEKKLDINMGIYTYPILMTSDILTINPNLTVVGADQKQHMEYCNILAKRYCKRYNLDKDFTDISSIIFEKQIYGNDGRKMSKSYNNTITPFMDRKEIENIVMKIKTSSASLGESLDINNFYFAELLRFYSKNDEFLFKKNELSNGKIGWKELKEFMIKVIIENKNLYNKTVFLSRINKKLEDSEQFLLRRAMQNPFLQNLSS